MRPMRLHEKDYPCESESEAKTKNEAVSHIFKMIKFTNKNSRKQFTYHRRITYLKGDMINC